MAKVPVVGATGPVGANLVSTYKEQGKEVRALVRPESLENCLIKRTFYGSLLLISRCN
ncbi:NmrA family NAD(P)-binding protein [Pricia sp.]|uniref:NmrA family NAD(P)-binding protein n=1 Tax=Pricia sp. TaxID=2268138 RepID=UPI0035944544